MAESLAGQYGCHSRDWAGDGHMFLFESADAAVQYGLKLLAAWGVGRDELATLRKAPRLHQRLGCHFGECTPLDDGGAWVGRANAIAKRVEGEAEQDSLCVTESLLDLLDLPLYEFEAVGERALKGDYLPSRRLYPMLAFHEEALTQKSPEDLTAQEWFLRGVALVGTSREWSAEEGNCYRKAIDLRPEFAEAHNNLAILLRVQGQAPEAAGHYQEALRIRPKYPEAHYNYALLLEARGDSAGSEAHYRDALRLRADYQVLVSNLVRELVAGGGPGIDFLECRDVELKGLDGSHRLFAVDLT